MFCWDEEFNTGWNFPLISTSLITFLRSNSNREQVVAQFITNEPCNGNTYAFKQFDTHHKKLIDFLPFSFSQPFSDLLRQLLHNSKDMFHNMFKQTYGLLYEQNSYVFSELFVKLEGYLLRGRLDLTEMLDQFFNQLYKKMFTVINGNYHFDEA